MYHKHTAAWTVFIGRQSIAIYERLGNIKSNFHPGRTGFEGFHVLEVPSQFVFSYFSDLVLISNREMVLFGVLML